jgi:membrane-bound lytic murein transglycosylase D
MKTMLKKNLVRTSFFGHGLFLLMPGASVMKGEPHQMIREIHVAATHRIAASMDTTIITDRSDSSGLLISSDGSLAKKSVAPSIELNRHATKFVSSYMKREEEALAMVKAKSASYFKLIDEVLTKYNLPLELKYLAVVESDLTTTAVSRVGAKGMWQLMPQTARELGLKVSAKYDERTHAYRSTVAAAKYLRDLYSQFGDWLLVIAAYNGGPGTVYNAIHRSGSRNFWALQNFLPEESRGHVKRFIGTHYYFEGTGSLTTMTKSETIAYTRAVDAFNATEQVVDSATVVYAK